MYFVRHLAGLLVARTRAQVVAAWKLAHRWARSHSLARGLGAPAAAGARFARATYSNLPLARLPGRPRLLGFVGQAANAFVVSFWRKRGSACYWLRQLTCLTIRSSGPLRMGCG